MTIAMWQAMRIVNAASDSGITERLPMSDANTLCSADAPLTQEVVMKSASLCLIAAIMVLAPVTVVHAQARASLGYAVATYMEEGGGTAPLGFYFSVAYPKMIGFEGEVAYHRDSEEFTFLYFSDTIVLNTVTMMGGPRFDFRRR
jgi:hypothetical protein